MQMTRLALVFVFTVNGLAGLCCLAADPMPAIDSVLARWEEASRKCQSLDAKLTVFSYDRASQGDKPSIAQGRFYYEAPDKGRVEFKEGGTGRLNDWSQGTTAFVWRGGETLWIDAGRRTYHRFPTAKLAEPAKPHTPPGTNQGLFSGFFAVLDRISVKWSRLLRDPREAIPMVLDIHAAKIKDEYRLILERKGEDFLLTAVPKQPGGDAVAREIDVILDPKTTMTSAVQLVYSDGKRDVYQFEDRKLNQRPADREALLNPDLSGLRMEDEERTEK